MKLKKRFRILILFFLLSLWFDWFGQLASQTTNTQHRKQLNLLEVETLLAPIMNIALWGLQATLKPSGTLTILEPDVPSTAANSSSCMLKTKGPKV